MTAVGAVSERRARLWFRTELAGPFVVELRREGAEPRTATLDGDRSDGADGTRAFTVPDDVEGLVPLDPETEYEFRISTTRGETVGGGRFETAPVEGSPRSFAFAFLSCHQPFLPDGSLHPDAARMLACLEPALEERKVRYALLLGDQIYADLPRDRRLVKPDSERPLPGLTVEEVRARYQRRYRQFWSLAETRALQSRRATWCMWDDHEIVDNWGANLVHQRPEWRRVFEGAKRAYVDYEASRAMAYGETFLQSFVWGSTATIVLDPSSERSFDGESATVYGEEQFRALAEFLDANRHRAMLFVVVTVPVAFLPDWFVGTCERVPGFYDALSARWNAKRNRRTLDRLLDLVRRHARENPHQKLVLLSGDIHMAAAHALVWPRGERVYQLVSSAVTNSRRPWDERVAQWMSFAMESIRHREERVRVLPLASASAGHENPFRGLNVGIVTVEAGSTAGFRFELVTYDERSPGAPRVVFDGRVG